MKRILVDTSIIIDFFRSKDKAKSLFYQVFSKSKHQAVITLITVTELWAGKSMRQKAAIEVAKELIGNCEILFPDLEIAQETGRILRETDYQVSFQDAQIAALAKKNKLPVLTLNLKDFKKIKRLKLFLPDSV